MVDYIDREKIFSIWRSMPAPASVTSLAAAISQTPAADVVEARHGRWEMVPYNGVYDIRCSSCGYCPGIRFYSSNYCPNCGALMREIENGEK